MLFRLFRWSVLGLAVLPSLHSQEPAGALPIETGIWSGGHGSLEGERVEWVPLGIAFERKGASLSGEAAVQGVPMKLSGTIDGDPVEFRFGRSIALRVFRGQLQGDTLIGTIDVGGRTDVARLVRERAGPATADAGNAGIYADEAGTVLVRLSRHLVFLEPATGLSRALYTYDGERYRYGPRLAVPAPVSGEMRFGRDPTGRIDALVWETAEGGTRTLKRIGPAAVQPFAFRSHGFTLHGDLYLPPGEGPHPAVVWVHGSGKATRAGAGSWPLFLVSQGFAALAVDKRGVGASEGRYELADGGHDNRAHMLRRAEDVAAAVQALKARPEILDERVGLMGGSQAGWVMPVAAGLEPVLFTITVSGGATALSVEGRFSDQASELAADASSRSVEEVVEELRSYQPRDPDFDDYFAAQTAPGLWLYGGRDRSNPSILCKERIERLAAEHRRDFTVALFPEGNHSLFLTRHGGGAETHALDLMVPGLHARIEAWLREKGFTPAAAR
ncbi:MAG TPA: CocE/NonD family hydrolase [Planctomycetota bacterium]